jgi:CheY-like chemotaxis protein
MRDCIKRKLVSSEQKELNRIECHGFAYRARPSFERPVALSFRVSRSCAVFVMATILVVDDNSINRKVLVSLLSADGHLTLEASDGLEGLHLARTRRPQLIISDIVMPTMDGYRFVRALRLDAQLRCDSQLRLIPVILYTAHYH